mgnify:CR=1 FL=1
MSKVVFMFPGQGAQYIGMGKDFYDACEESKAVYAVSYTHLTLPTIA